MKRAGTAHLDQFATRSDLENHRLLTKADLKTGLANLKSELRADLLKVAVGIVVTNAGFVLAAVKFLS